MSRAHVEQLRRVVEALNRGDWEAWIAEWHPDAVFYDRSDLALDTPRVVRGHEGLHALRREWVDTFEEFRFELAEVVDLGTQAVLVGRWSGTGKESGVPIEYGEAILCSFSGGMVLEGHSFPSKEAAIAAASERRAGLREGAPR